MSPARTAVALALLFAACACQGGGQGCEFVPLASPLADSVLQPRAVELYLPPGRLESLGALALARLSQDGQANLTVEWSELSGSLGDTLTWSLDAGTLALPLQTAAIQGAPDGLAARLELAPVEPSLHIDVQQAGEPLRTCQLTLRVPGRVFEALLAAGVDELGAAALTARVDQAPDGEALELELEQNCPQHEGSDLESVLLAAMEEAIAAAAPALADELAAAAGGLLGLECGGDGQGSGLRFALTPDPQRLDATAGGVRIALGGGFEAERAACVPSGLSPPAPGPELAAVFSDGLPTGGGAYGQAVAVSPAWLHAGLVAVHRSGQLCRCSGDGPVTLALDDLFPSLSAFGQLGAVRLGVWPRERPEMAFVSTPAGAELPRVAVALPEVALDFFTELEGADVRLLGLVADFTLTFAPRLEGMEIILEPAGVVVTELRIEQADLPGESGAELRAAATTAAERAAAALTANLRLALPRPAAGAGELLEARLQASGLVLYFGP